jgi:hypothetical protein
MALDYTTAAEALAEATTLHTGLNADLPLLPDLPVPDIITIPGVGEVPLDMQAEVNKPTVDQLTQGAVGGAGIFDKVMATVSAHIEGQYHKGIIGQSEVAQVYIAAIQTVLPQSLQFLLNQEQTYWATRLVQLQAQNTYLERAKLIAEVETAKLLAFRTQAEAYAAQVAAMTAQMTYANSKMLLVKTLQDINLSEAQQAVVEESFNDAWLKTHTTMPGGGAAGGHAQKDFALKDAALVTAEKQQLLLTGQANVQRAQTYDTNTDTTPVAGIMGVQKLLYTQQIQSYKDDGQNKAVKMVADLWTSAKALDDATQSPGPLAGNLILSMNKYLNNLGLPHAYNNPDTPATGAPSADADPYTPGDQ